MKRDRSRSPAQATAERTHGDFLSVIGGTTATGRTYRERRWNQYYERCFRRTVARLLQGCHGPLLDVGTSHGHWYPFWRERKFTEVYGVELDPNRAELARKMGYTEVYTCDASSMPIASNSIGVAVSNDVFVHILRLRDKVAVFREVERVLAPGGAFIVNHPMSVAAGYSGYTVDGYCSWLTLAEFVELPIKNTDFRVVDVKPTYYHWRAKEPPLIEKLARRFIWAPAAVPLLVALADRHAAALALEESETVYVKLLKPRVDREVPAPRGPSAHRRVSDTR